MVNKMSLLFLVFLASVTQSSPDVQKKKVDSINVLVCSAVEYVKKDSTNSRRLRMIKFIYNNRNNTAKYEPWIFLDVNDKNTILESDGYMPYLDFTGTAKINDSVIVFTGQIGDYNENIIKAQPAEKQQMLRKMVREKLGLDKTFIRYITHNKLDTLWNERGTDFFFRKIR